MTSPATLADIAPDADLMFWCRACHHQATMPIRLAIALHGATREVASIRGRCRQCGSTDVDVRPDWRPKGPPMTRH
jgi:hypothetical protein